MAHAQKPDFVFRRNGRVHLNRRGASVQSTTGSRGVRICGSNAGYTMFRGSVKGTGYPLHSQISPSLPLPCVTVCHHTSTGVYHSEVTKELPWIQLFQTYLELLCFMLGVLHYIPFGRTAILLTCILVIITFTSGKHFGLVYVSG